MTSSEPGKLVLRGGTLRHARFGKDEANQAFLHQAVAQIGGQIVIGPGAGLVRSSVDTGCGLARALGATTILRYYDWAEGPTREKFDFYLEPGPTLPGKTLTQKERDLIFSKGFSLGVVFQHRNDLRKTFLDTKRAGFDARRALQLAQELGQPKGSVIFFSVDFDAREKNIEHVKRYFETVGEMVGAANYRAGVYGDGYVCAELKRAGLASYCWLSMSTGFSGSRAYHASGRWDVKQCASREASGRSAVNFDPDVFNASSGKLPLWGLK